VRHFQRLFLFMLLLGAVNATFASAFQLWEQDGASVGNYHAGRAAVADNASTGFYNPAGLIRIPNQQLVLAADPIVTDFLFDGNISVTALDIPPFISGPAEAQGGTFNLVPSFGYAAPITDYLVFGFNIVAPFGLKTDYGDDTLARYAATLTSLRVIDFTPSLGLAINKKLSIGAGVDFEHANAQFDLVTGFLGNPGEFDTTANNKAAGNGIGFHVGILYQFSPETRMGLSYQSRVIFHLREGDSDFTGPLANDTAGGSQSSDELATDFTLPPTTTLSIFHSLNAAWDVMATVSYTQWDVFESVILENVAGIDNDLLSTNTLTVVVPENYHNTWNYAIGANYHLNEQWFFRSGIGFDETPSNDDDRNLQLPDADRTVLALGVHYQPLKTLGFDISWSHFFTGSTPIDVLQPFGPLNITTKGDVTGNADVYGFQMTWNIV